MWRYIKVLTALFLFFFLFSSTNFIYKKFTKSFRISAINYTSEKGKEALPEAFKSLESQKFYFLDKGAQSFVFLSEDKKTVLKFVRYDHLLPKLFIRFFSFIPHPFIQSKIKDSDQKTKDLWESFEIASQDIANHTCPTYLQKKELIKPLTIIDPLGLAHKIKKATFLIQPYIPTVESVIEHLREDQLKSLIDQYFNLILLRQEKGIGDSDPDLLTNFGWIEGKLIQFDTGRFYRINKRKPKVILKNQIDSILQLVWPKILSKYPQLKAYGEEKMNQL